MENELSRKSNKKIFLQLNFDLLTLYLFGSYIMKITLLLGLFILLSCNTTPQAGLHKNTNIDSVKMSLKKHQQKKDSSFVTEKWSPLTEEAKADFKGLQYYPYDSKYRFVAPIIPYEKQDSMLIIGSKHNKGRNDQRPAIRYGYFQFDFQGKPHRLDVIKIISPKNEEGYLFLGFYDETSGAETYGGGRYIDLEETKDGKYIVDFNKAYNPYCAYSDRYSCAIPPLENHLLFKVLAGEKSYKTTPI
jgi:uncharacterized protein (DUF1684 family)